MRHRRKVTKLGRSASHRKATLASLVCALIEQRRITTTLSKAKLARSFAEKMVTVARRGLQAEEKEKLLAARRHAISELFDKRHVKTLFDDITPQLDGRNGGYTRIIKLGHRRGDCADMAILEWVGITAPNKKKKKKVEKVSEKA